MTCVKAEMTKSYDLELNFDMSAINTPIAFIITWDSLGIQE